MLSDMKRLRELEDEKGRLKRIVADLSLSVVSMMRGFGTTRC